MLLKKIENIFIVVAIFITVIFMVRSSQKRDKLLKENGILLTCKIIDVSMGKNSSFECEFYYNGKYLRRTAGSRAKKTTYFLYQYFPLIYAPDIDAARLLITPKDFEDYGIAFPDSLKWVIDDNY
jgi:hypothetical protein